MSAVVGAPRSMGSLLAGEERLLAALNNEQETGLCRVAVSPGPGQMVVRAGFFRWFLLAAISLSQRDVQRVEVVGLTFDGGLDLQGAPALPLLKFENCLLPHGLDATDAQLKGLHLIGGAVDFIRANRINISGSLLLRAPLDDIGAEEPVKAGEFEIGRDAWFSGARIGGNLDLRGARVGRLLVPGRRRVAIRADGAKIRGSVLLGSGFRASGGLALDGSEIGRNLDCTGAVLRNPAGFSLSAAGARIGGSLYTRSARDGAAETFRSRGIVRLEGAFVMGDWKAAGAQFFAPATLRDDWTPAGGNYLGAHAIQAKGLEVRASVYLNDDCHIRGVIELINARIGGDLNMSGAQLDLPGEEMLYADGARIEGAVFLDETRTNGLLRFVQTELKQGLFANKTTFDLTGRWRDWLGISNVAAEELGLDVCGIHAAGSRIGGSFYWRRIRKIPQPQGYRRLVLWVVDCAVDSVEDDETSWELLDQIEVRNCRYGSIGGLSADTMWRADLLDLAYAPLNRSRQERAGRAGVWRPRLGTFWRSLKIVLASPRKPGPLLQYAILAFSPQPYLQLAKVVRRAGYEAAANDIVVRLERNRTRYGGFGFWRQIGRWLIDGLVRYGFSPFRPIWLLLGWALISSLFFEYAYVDHRLVPTFENMEHYSRTAPAAGEGMDIRYQFNPVVFALDTLIPLVDLNQKKNWHVEPLQGPARAEDSMPDHPTLREIVLRLWSNVPDSSVGMLILFNTFSGWVLTSVLAAGVTGLLRSRPAEEPEGSQE